MECLLEESLQEECLLMEGILVECLLESVS